MGLALRIMTGLFGALFTLLGVGWLFRPEQAAEQLKMPVLDGMARSTQFGDFAAFFLTLGIGVLVGAIKGRGDILYFPSALLGSAAIGRTLAWAIHGADFAGFFISVEVVACVVLYATAKTLAGKAG